MQNEFDQLLIDLEKRVLGMEPITYFGTRGDIKPNSQFEIWNWLLWELTDLICSRTDKYKRTRNAAAGTVDSGVNVIALAIAAKFGIGEAVASKLTTEAFRILSAVSIDQLCPKLPFEKAGIVDSIDSKSE